MNNNVTIIGFKNTGNGGGVFIDSGKFEMKGGKIQGNSASNGGGVYLSNGTFEMSGGNVYGIDGNYPNYNAIPNIATESDSASFYMNNGATAYYSGNYDTPQTIPLSTYNYTLPDYR